MMRWRNQQWLLAQALYSDLMELEWRRKTEDEIDALLQEWGFMLGPFKSRFFSTDASYTMRNVDDDQSQRVARSLTPTWG